MADTIDPLVLLQEDLKDDDYETQIASINRLTTIAHALGPHRTRQELIPFLLEYSRQDNDEAQTAVATQMSEMLPYIGGPTYGTVLLPLLEKLAGAEECVIINAAVKSLVEIVGQLPKKDVTTKFIPVLRRLANGDWFTTRVSACGLFACCYPVISDPSIQSELRILFSNLCNDDTPMVRKAAYQNLGSFSMKVDKQEILTDFMPILKQLSTDDMGAMRIFTVDCSVDIGSLYNGDEFITNFLPLLEALQDDNSWRVRQRLARKMASICKGRSAAVGHQLLPIFCKLLADKEAEVRSAAAAELANVCLEAHANNEVMMTHVVPMLDSLVHDPVESVKVSFSKSVVGLAPFFHKETATKVLLLIITEMTKDDVHTVRHNIIHHLGGIMTCLNAEEVAIGLLPPILDLSKDPKWRVRMAVVNKVGVFGKVLGVKIFEKKLQSILIQSLSDHVYAIRKAACAQVGVIVKLFGGKWASEKFFPTAFQIYDKTTNCLHRMTCLQLIQNVLTEDTNSCPIDVIEKNLLPIVTQGCTDDVANVRIGAAKAAKDILTCLSPSPQSELKALLTTMTEDPDVDVQYFSTVALMAI